MVPPGRETADFSRHPGAGPDGVRRAVTIYRIIRRDAAPPLLELTDEKRESPEGTFSGLLQVADTFDRIAKESRARFADIGLEDNQLLMFHVPNQPRLWQLIGRDKVLRKTGIEMAKMTEQPMGKLLREGGYLWQHIHVTQRAAQMGAYTATHENVTWLLSDPVKPGH